jgi:hypothetical protein
VDVKSLVVLENVGVEEDAENADVADVAVSVAVSVGVVEEDAVAVSKEATHSPLRGLSGSRSGWFIRKYVLRGKEPGAFMIDKWSTCRIETESYNTRTALNDISLQGAGWMHGPIHHFGH